MILHSVKKNVIKLFLHDPLASQLFSFNEKYPGYSQCIPCCNWWCIDVSLLRLFIVAVQPIYTVHKSSI